MDAEGKYRAWLGPTLRGKIAAWLAEDCPGADWAGQLVGNRTVEALLYAKSGGVLAGGPAVTEIFQQLDCIVAWHVAEGAELLQGRGGAATGEREIIATVTGPACNLLLGERLALNLLSRVSGIATLTRRLRNALNARGDGARVQLADTRKTTPGNLAVSDH